MTEVKLFKQSLKELIETDNLLNDQEGPLLSDILGKNLEFVCMVSAINSYNALPETNGALKQEAAKVGADYVFGIEYKFHDTTILAYGDAYKVNKKVDDK